MLERKKPFDELGIDFAELERRKGAEYEKLDRVIGYARTRTLPAAWKFWTISAISGKARCGNCDNCRPVLARPASVKKQSKESQEIRMLPNRKSPG